MRVTSQFKLDYKDVRTYSYNLSPDQIRNRLGHVVEQKSSFWSGPDIVVRFIDDSTFCLQFAGPNRAIGPSITCTIVQVNPTRCYIEVIAQSGRNAKYGGLFTLVIWALSLLTLLLKGEILASLIVSAIFFLAWLIYRIKAVVGVVSVEERYLRHVHAVLK